MKDNPMHAEQIRVLLIEDEQVLADVTAFRLELLGYEVQVAATAAAALQIVQQAAPDLVILDLSIPDVSTITLISQLQNESETEHELPVLVFSTDADLDLVQQAYRAGARDYLVTPYDPASLEGKIESLLAVKV